MKVNPKKFHKSILNALRGLGLAIKTEQNFKILFFFGIAVIVLGIFLSVRPLHFALLILVVAAVWVLELLNTVMEKFIDIMKPRIHHYAAQIKDITAAAVLIMSLAALTVVILVFSTYIFA